METSNNPFGEHYLQVTLQRLLLGQHAVVSDDAVLHNPRIEVFRDEFMRAMVVRLYASIWADAPTEVRCMYPRDWWEAFKERWFPEWALEAYPVDYEITTLNARHIYPKLSLKTPEGRPWLRMTVNRESAQ